MKGDGGREGGLRPGGGGGTATASAAAAVELRPDSPAAQSSTTKYAALCIKTTFVSRQQLCIKSNVQLDYA